MGEDPELYTKGHVERIDEEYKKMKTALITPAETEILVKNRWRDYTSVMEADNEEMTLANEKLKVTVLQSIVDLHMLLSNGEKPQKPAAKKTVKKKAAKKK